MKKLRLTPKSVGLRKSKIDWMEVWALVSILLLVFVTAYRMGASI